MATNLAQSLSPWIASSNLPTYPPLHNDLETESCIIGGGVAGLCIAYRLCRENRKVAVLMQGTLADSETAHTTAHLTKVLDTRYFELEKLFGSHEMGLIAASHARAIDWIEEVAHEENIECEFHRLDGYLFASDGPSAKTLDDELDAARRAGLEVVRLQEALPQVANAPPSLKFSNQGQFHPLKFLAGLARAIERMGGQIFCDTHVDQIEDGTHVVVAAESGDAVTAGSAVIASGSPFSNRVILQTKLAAYRTYAIAARLTPDSLPQGLYWDTDSPYHYVRMQNISTGNGKGMSYLIVGGEDHKTGQASDTDERYHRLEKWMRLNYPMTGEVEYRWSGQVLEPVDGLAYIGRNPGDENVFVVTGTSGNGMTYGAISGLLISDLILGRSNPWSEIYKPSRITLGATKRFLEENLNVAARYMELITPGEVRSIEDIPPDSGAVLRQGMKKMAVYRDENGETHCFSAICPHLECIVHWNSAERSWDCPCHGSRFDRFGKVINGPAIKDLPVI